MYQGNPHRGCFDADETIDEFQRVGSKFDVALWFVPVLSSRLIEIEQPWDVAHQYLHQRRHHQKVIIAVSSRCCCDVIDIANLRRFAFAFLSLRVRLSFVHRLASYLSKPDSPLSLLSSATQRLSRLSPIDRATD